MSPPLVKCPTCKREIDWAEAPFRPFCSDRCRLIDLGGWLSEQRSIPGDAQPTEGEADAERQLPHDPQTH
ncbi:MAG TPA: DNA gyrase inhibitor YacG [Steroidobacteraceae bacterium]